MSWDILPKSNLQYFLTKLKGIFDLKVDKEAGKGLFSGSYNDLNDKPTIPAAVAVKGDTESNYRTGNVNLTPANIGALPISGGTISGNILPDNNYSYGLGNYGHAFGAVSAANYYVDDSVNGGRSKVYFEGSGLLNSVKIPEGNGTMATEAYVAKLRVEKTLAEFNALTPAEQDDPEIVYYVTDKPSLGYPIQDNGSATDLTDGALATGRTIESWANSKIGLSLPYLNVYNGKNPGDTISLTNGLIFLWGSGNSNRYVGWKQTSALYTISSAGSAYSFSNITTDSITLPGGYYVYTIIKFR